MNSFDQTARDQLRNQLRLRRNELSANERLAASMAMASKLLPILAEMAPGYVAGYWAVDAELPLHAVQMRLPKDLVWCLPIVQADKSLLFAPWKAGDHVTTNKFGIPEPDIDPRSALSADQMKVVLLPLTGFTRTGYRLGMGGGFYDRSLAFCRDRDQRQPLRIGIAYACQEIDQALDAQAWDVELNAVATEREYLAFT